MNTINSLLTGIEFTPWILHSLESPASSFSDLHSQNLVFTQQNLKTTSGPRKTSYAKTSFAFSAKEMSPCFWRWLTMRYWNSPLLAWKRGILYTGQSFGIFLLPWKFRNEKTPSEAWNCPKQHWEHIPNRHFVRETSKAPATYQRVNQSSTR